MSANRFEIGYDPSSVQLLHGMTARQDVPLLHIPSLDSPVRALESWAYIHPDPEAFDRLHISTELSLQRPSMSQALVVREVVHDLSHRLNGHIVSEVVSKTSIMGALMLVDTLLEDVSTLAMPFLGGKQWHINSSLDSFGASEQLDIDGVVSLLTQHSMALTSLIRVVFNDHHPEHARNGVRPRVFDLSVPAAYARRFPEAISPAETESQDAFSQFIGIDEHIAKLRRMVKLANTPASVLAANNITPIKACMLTGESGLGKTELTKALAVALEAEPVYIKLGDVASSLTGDWAKSVDKFFTDAYAKTGRVLLIFDEFEGLVKNGNPDSTGNIMNVMKTQLETLQQYPHVFFVAATNRPDVLDSAMIADKRIPVKIKLTMPTVDQKAALLQDLLYVRKAAAMDHEDVEALEVLASRDYDFRALAEAADILSPGDIMIVLNRISVDKLLDSPESTSFAPPTQQEVIDAIWANRRDRLT